jgi:diadenosine tetraphosphate (Ap4A) HIT family hydrolase
MRGRVNVARRAGQVAVRPAGCGMAFTLHPRLANGTFDLGRIGISRLLLKNNALFPWFLLVPEVEEGIEDLHQLDEAQYADVTRAIRRVSQFITDYFQPEKLNVASIGNQVRQMHVHLIGRSPEDPAWPGTVWAFDGKQPYAPEQVEAIRSAVAEAFAG